MKHSRLGIRYALLIAGLGLLAVLVMDFNNRMAELRRLTAERELVAARLSGYQATEAALEAEIKYATSEAAVEEWAYNQGHMTRPGDVPVVPLQPGEVTMTPTPTPVVEQRELTNWEKWMELFFGPRTP